MTTRNRAIGAIATAILATGVTACSPTSTTVQTNSAAPSGSASGSTSTASATVQSGKLSPNGSDLSKYTSQQLQWSASTCPSSMDSVLVQSRRTECATVAAPKDYSDPTKGDLTLMVARTTAKNPGGRPLFTNPGGPGAPAGAFSAIVAAITTQGRTHDVYGVDPRGTGASTPVSCKRYGSNSDDARDRSSTNVQAEQAAAKKTVDDCWRAHGDYLPYITTDNTARDHELVRQLIGVDTIDYYGVSAGTWLGARYATLFPKHVGRFVLDSNTDFAANFDRTFNAQAEGFQRRFDEQFVPWLARHDASYGMGPDNDTVKANFEKIRSAAKNGKLGDFTPDAIDGISAQLMYADRSFKSLGALLDLLLQAADGDESALRAAESAAGSAGSSGSSDDSENTVFMATLCNDTPWPTDPASVSAAEQTSGTKYPLVGYSSPGMECAYWPHPAPQTVVDLKGAPEILMLQTEMDPATPYGPAIDAHHKTSNTRLLSIDNQGNHGAYAGGGNPCVEKVVSDFLDDGRLIPTDSVCPAVPLPKDSQVYAVGNDLPGTQLPMPQAQGSTVGEMIKQLLLALLDQILKPVENK